MQDSYPDDYIPIQLIYSQYACEAYENIWPIFGPRLIICRVLSAFPGASSTWIALSRKPT